MITKTLIIKREQEISPITGELETGFSGLNGYSYHSVRDISLQKVPVTITGFALVEITAPESTITQLEADPEVLVVDKARWRTGDFARAAQFSIDNNISVTDLELDIPMFNSDKAKAGAQGIVNKRKEMGV